jgi:voltage-gated potassium channel
MNCSCAIILAEITAENRSSSMPDSKSILTVLTIESLRPEVYTVAEVLDPCNIPHFKRANVDEIVASSEFTGKLLVQATLNHGITSLFENMLTFSEGSEIYKFSVPRGLAGLTFREVHLKMFDKEYNVIAMEKQEKIILHPATTTRVEAEDFLYGICETEPLQEQLDSLFTPQQS